MGDTLRRADPGDELTDVLLSRKLHADGGQMRMGEEMVVRRLHESLYRWQLTDGWCPTAVPAAKQLFGPVVKVSPEGLARNCTHSDLSPNPFTES